MGHVSSFKIESIMENINYRAVFAIVTGIAFAASQPILAEEASSQKRMDTIEEVFVIKKNALQITDFPMLFRSEITLLMNMLKYFLKTILNPTNSMQSYYFLFSTIST